MSYAPLPISDDDLQAFVDNEIDEERREAITAYLAANPSDAARVDGWRQQNILLRAAFAQVALEQVPPSLTFSFAPRLIKLPSFVPTGTAAREAFIRRAQRRSLVFTCAAFIAGVCITLAATVALTRYSAHPEAAPFGAQGPALATLATAALKTSDDAATGPTSGLNLAGAVEPALGILPSLKSEGLELVRGEVRGKPDDLATCLDFVDIAKAAIALCIAPAKAPNAADAQGLAVASANSVYWREDGSLYALAGPSKITRLVALARRIHAALALPPSP